MPPPTDPITELEQLLGVRIRELGKALLAWAFAKAAVSIGKAGAVTLEAAGRERVRRILVDVLGASHLAGRAHALEQVLAAASAAKRATPERVAAATKVLTGRGPLRIPKTMPVGAPTEADALGLLVSGAPDGAVRVGISVEAVDEVSGLVAPVPPTPAMDAMARRVPVIAEDAAEVARLYNASSEVFSAVRLADEAMGRRVRTEIVRLMGEGASPQEAADVIAGMTGWSTSYAQTVFVTNANTAYTQGVLAELQMPGVREIMPAIQTIGPDDAVTRRGRPEDRGENHQAGIGLCAALEDPVWDRAMPLWGYNCRHTIRGVSIFELERRGLLGAGGRVIRWEPPGFSNFAPHPAFVGRGAL